MDQNSTLSQNTANNSLMYQTYTPIFGNLNFQIQPSQTGEVNYQFSQVPYFSLEGMIYLQQMQGQSSPINTTSGANQGQQNIQGSYGIQDSNGLSRMVMGYSPGGF